MLSPNTSISSELNPPETRPKTSTKSIAPQLIDTLQDHIFKLLNRMDPESERFLQSAPLENLEEYENIRCEWYNYVFERVHDELEDMLGLLESETVATEQADTIVHNMVRVLNSMDFNYEERLSCGTAEEGHGLVNEWRWFRFTLAGDMAGLFAEVGARLPGPK